MPEVMCAYCPCCPMWMQVEDFIKPICSACYNEYGKPGYCNLRMCAGFNKGKYVEPDYFKERQTRRAAR